MWGRRQRQVLPLIQFCNRTSTSAGLYALEHWISNHLSNFILKFKMSHTYVKLLVDKQEFDLCPFCNCNTKFELFVLFFIIFIFFVYIYIYRWNSPSLLAKFVTKCFGACACSSRNYLVPAHATADNHLYLSLLHLWYLPMLLLCYLSLRFVYSFWPKQMLFTV